MDAKWAAIILLGALGGRAEAAEPIQVEVYVQQSDWTEPLGFTERLASEMFGKIDVRLKWHAGETPAACASPRCIGIRMVPHAPLSLNAGALASAHPFSSGSSISVYEDRVRHRLATLPSVSRFLLACVFVHELAHAMQRNDYHSNSGVLRAFWSSADYDAMRAGRLGLTNLDAERIQDGLRTGLFGTGLAER